MAESRVQVSLFFFPLSPALLMPVFRKWDIHQIPFFALAWGYPRHRSHASVTFGCFKVLEGVERGEVLLVGEPCLALGSR